MFIGFRSSNINNPKWLDIQRNLIWILDPLGIQELFRDFLLSF
jgi:hypothetical protein